MEIVLTFTWAHNTTNILDIKNLTPVFFFFFQLEILTNLANEANISTILREFQVCVLFLNEYQ